MAAQRKLKGKAGISFSEIDVRSAKIHQCLVLFPAFQEQRTRFSTAVPANEAIATTAFDAQMCTAQNLKPGGTSLGAFAFRGGYIRGIGTLLAQQDYAQIMYVNLEFRISIEQDWVLASGLTSLFSAPSAMWKRVCWQDTWIEVEGDVMLCGSRWRQYLGTMLRVLVRGR
jgi:hypothetical protein